MKLFSRLSSVGCISPSSADYLSVNQEIEKIIPATNHFGLALLKECCVAGKEKGINIFFSPFGISSSLSTAAIGAHGSTKTQILSALNVSDILDAELEQSFQLLMDKTISDASSAFYNLCLVNALFLHKEIKVNEGYLEVVKDSFRAEHNMVDFLDLAEESRKAINHWIETESNQKIQNLFPEGTLDDSCHSLLVTTVHFSSLWKHKFDQNRTFRSPFHVSNQETVEVNMMQVAAEFHYAQCRELQVSCVELPYSEERFAMMVILPDEVEGIETLETRLNPQALNKLLGLMEKRSDVQVYLPRFKVDSTIYLKTELTELGIKDMFTNDADLSTMMGVKGTPLTQVVHRAMLEVKEDGGDLASSSGMVMRLNCAIIPTEFVVNHPFVVLVRDVKSGVIIFMGSIKRIEF